MCRTSTRIISIITILSMLMLTAFISALSVPAYAKAATSEEISITLVTDSNGLEGEYSYTNDDALTGLLNAEKKFGVVCHVIESSSPDDYVANIEAAMSNSPDLIITIGYTMIDATIAAAEANPNQKFAAIDAFIELPNVTSLLFKEQEGAFVVGLIAGLTTQTNIVGFVGGMNLQVINEFEFGFKAGVLSTNPSVELLEYYTGSFIDSDGGYAAAQEQFDAGADVIFHAAGPTGDGVIQAADDLGFWAIGVDMDQSSLAPDAVLCSMVKNIDVATYSVAKSLVEGTLTGGLIELGLAEDGVGYSDNAGNVPKKVAAMVKKYVRAVCRGSIIVPYDEDTFNEFLAPLN